MLPWKPIIWNIRGFPGSSWRVHVEACMHLGHPVRFTFMFTSIATDNLSAQKANWTVCWPKHCPDNDSLVVWNMTSIFPFSWECHPPNWRVHILQRGWNHQPGHIWVYQPSSDIYIYRNHRLPIYKPYTNHILTIYYRWSTSERYPFPAGLASGFLLARGASEQRSHGGRRPWPAPVVLAVAGVTL